MSGFVLDGRNRIGRDNNSPSNEALQSTWPREFPRESSSYGNRALSRGCRLILRHLSLGFKQGSRKASLLFGPLTTSRDRFNHNVPTSDYGEMPSSTETCYVKRVRNGTFGAFREFSRKTPRQSLLPHKIQVSSASSDVPRTQRTRASHRQAPIALAVHSHHQRLSATELGISPA